MGYRWYWTVDSDHVITNEDQGCYVRWKGCYYRTKYICATQVDPALSFWSKNPRAYNYHPLNSVLYAHRIFLPKHLYEAIRRNPFLLERAYP
jgi:hypothetical protein